MVAPRFKLRFWRALALISCCCAAGCDGPVGGEPDTGTDAQATSRKPDSGFRSAEALLEHLRGYGTTDDALGIR